MNFLPYCISKNMTVLYKSSIYKFRVWLYLSHESFWNMTILSESPSAYEILRFRAWIRSTPPVSTLADAAILDRLGSFFSGKVMVVWLRLYQKSAHNKSGRQHLKGALSMTWYSQWHGRKTAGRSRITWNHNV